RNASQREKMGRPHGKRLGADLDRRARLLSRRTLCADCRRAGKKNEGVRRRLSFHRKPAACQSAARRGRARGRYRLPGSRASARPRQCSNRADLCCAERDAAQTDSADHLAILSRRRARLHASQGAGRQSCSHGDRLTTARCISHRLPIVMASARVGMKNRGKKTATKKRSAKERRYSDILYEVRDQVAWATINRPRVLNAFREQTLDELIDALKSTRDDPSIACA